MAIPRTLCLMIGDNSNAPETLKSVRSDFGNRGRMSSRNAQRIAVLRALPIPGALDGIEAGQGGKFAPAALLNRSSGGESCAPMRLGSP